MYEKDSEVMCWGCQRTLEICVKNLGLCTKCFNAYGSPVVAAVGIGLVGGLK